MPSKQAMGPGQAAAAAFLMKLLAGSAMLGGAGRLGVGVMRAAAPTYEPPPPPKPLVVDVPVDAPDDVPPAPGNELRAALNARVKKAEAPPWWPLGESLWSKLPEHRPVGGRPDATSAGDVPLTGALAPLAIVGGVGGGYLAVDRVTQALKRRRAQAEIDAAKDDYRRAVLGRAVEARGLKAAAAAVLDDADVKAAVDRAYAAFTKAANPEPPALPAGEVDWGSRVLQNALWPGLALGPTAAMVNMGLVGGLGLLGGMAGYNSVRDAEQAKKLRKQIAALEADAARETTPPLVGRLVPVRRPAAAAAGGR